MPNLRGTSPVGCDGEDHSYAARMVSRGRPNQQSRDCGGVLGTVVKMGVWAWRVGKARRHEGRVRGRVGREHRRAGRNWESTQNVVGRVHESDLGGGGVGRGQEVARGASTAGAQAAVHGEGGTRSGRGGGMSCSLIFLELSLERKLTPFSLKMTARVCGGSLPLL